MLYRPLPRTLEAALRDIEDKKVQVRVSAAKDLVPHAEDVRERVVAALEKALSDSNALVRSAAADALGAIKGKEALPALLIAVEDEHQIVRQTALLALGDIGDTRAQKRIERALKDERPEVRFQAVMAYPRVTTSPSDATRALVEATADADDSVAHVAFRMAEELSQDERGVVDDAILERAVACLKHTSGKVRAVAAVLVANAGKSTAEAGTGFAGNKAADKVIQQIVEGRISDAEPEDVAAAVELAGERGLEGARPSLEKRAFGGLLGSRDPYQWHAKVALARMGDERAKKFILAELRAATFERRTLAASAAGRARLTEAKSALVAMKDRPDRAEPSAIDAALRLIEAPAGDA